MDKMKRIDSELMEIDRLQRTIKQHMMEYQYDLKIEVSKALGLTYDQVNLPYDEWAEIRNRYLESGNRVT